jgi:hypothetical protein
MKSTRPGSGPGLNNENFKILCWLHRQQRYNSSSSHEFNQSPVLGTSELGDEFRATTANARRPSCWFELA